MAQNLIGNDDARRGLLMDAVLSSPRSDHLAAHLIQAYHLAEQFATVQQAAVPQSRRSSTDAIRARNLLGFPGQRRASHEGLQNFAFDEEQAEEALAATLLPPLPPHGIARLLQSLARFGDVDCMELFIQHYGSTFTDIFPSSAGHLWREAMTIAEDHGHTDLFASMGEQSLAQKNLRRGSLTATPRRNSAPVQLMAPTSHRPISPFVLHAPPRARHPSPLRAMGMVRIFKRRQSLL